MTPIKTKSGLFETPPRMKNAATKSDGGAPARSSVSDPPPPRAKNTPTTPKPAKSSKQTVAPKADPSPHLNVQLHGRRHSIDHSPRSSISLDRSLRSVDSRPPVQPRLTRIPTLSDKRPGGGNGSELQAELNEAQEQLKNAKSRLTSLEKEKAEAMNELEVAKKEAEEANLKVKEAIAAQKLAEEAAEVEKFRVIELQQVGIEASMRKEQDLERARNQNTLDALSLNATTHEIQSLKHELAMTAEARNAATTHADEALKIAEHHADKSTKLSAEIDRLKSLLDSKIETNDEQIGKLNSDIETLRFELGKAKESETKLADMEALVGRLRIEVDDARKAEASARATLDGWIRKTHDVESKVEAANRSEELASASLASATKKLEDCNAALKKAESEISFLNKKAEILESELRRYRSSTANSNSRIETAKREVSESEKKVEILRLEIERMDSAAAAGMASSEIPALMEAKRRLLAELEASRGDVGRTRLAMDGLTSALDEASVEAKLLHEQLEFEEAAIATATAKKKESELAVATAKDRYEVLLAEAKEEVEKVANAVRLSKVEAEVDEEERSWKEANYANLMRRSEEEMVGIKEVMGKLASKLVEKEAEVVVAKEEEARLLSKLMQVKVEATSAKKVAEEVKAEVLEFKERLLDRENELQSISQENGELRVREGVASEKIKELSLLLERVAVKTGDKEDVAAVTSDGGKNLNSATENRISNNGNALLVGDEACIDKTEVFQGGPVQGVADPPAGKESSDTKTVDVDDGVGGTTVDDANKQQVRCEVEEDSLRSSSCTRIEKESFHGDSSSEGLSEKKEKKKKKSPFLSKFKNLLKKKEKKNLK